MLGMRLPKQSVLGDGTLLDPCHEITPVTTAMGGWQCLAFAHLWLPLQSYTIGSRVIQVIHRCTKRYSMTRTTPRVEDATLVDLTDPAQPIAVGTPAWYAWLAQATTFALIDPAGRFTARKERGGRADGYWRAYRKREGKVSIAYLGKSVNLTLDHLQHAAATLARAVATDQSVRSSVSPPARAAESSTRQQPAFPTGTTTMLFIDVADRNPQAIRNVLARATARLSERITTGGGQLFNTGADVVSAAFASSLRAVMVVRRLPPAPGAGQGQRIVPAHRLLAGRPSGVPGGLGGGDRGVPAGRWRRADTRLTVAAMHNASGRPTCRRLYGRT